MKEKNTNLAQIYKARKRTSKEYFITKIMLKEDSPEFLSLFNEDKIALKYVFKAGEILEIIQLQIDN